jgi:PiT family inorganic phosphate transporter
MLTLLLVLSIGFAVTNGIHDAGNAIAAPIVTRAMAPGPAVILAAVCHVVGALVVGTAVATTVGGIISVPNQDLSYVLAAAVAGALAWNVTTLWLGLPCSSGQCLIGALTGAALADRGVDAVNWGGVDAVNWGGLRGIRPVGVAGALLWLALSTALAVPLALLGVRALRRLLTRATRAVLAPIRHAEVVTTAALAFAHGSNDAQKTMGLLTLTLVAGHRIPDFSVPLWVTVVSAAALTLGTSLGGWRVVRTLGRGIYPLRSLEGLTSQGAASLIVLVASVVGAPISTTDVVAPAVVGVGAGQRWRHVRWRVVEEIGLAWLITLPVSAILAAVALPVSKAIQ